MGRCYLRSDSREESRRFINHELYRHDLLHLHPLPVPEIRRTPIYHGNVGEFRICRRSHHLHLHHALLVAASQQGNEKG